MISSFFSKTKPINYLVLLIFLLVFYLINLFATEIDFGNILLVVFFFGAILLQVIGVQEIVRTKKITDPTSFAMLFFVLLYMAIPQVIKDKEIVFCNLFLMLSLNRLLALKNLKQVKQKIFDATLWMCVASAFDPWALLFLIVVFLAVHVYGAREFKNWLVPFVASIFFLLLLSAFLILTRNVVFLQEHYVFQIPNNFSSHFIQNFSIKPFIYILVVIALILIVFVKQGYQGVGRIIHLRFLLVYFLIAIVVFLVQAVEANNYRLILYSFFPTANFIETFKRKRLKEVVLIACVLFPFVLLLFGVIK